MGISKSYEQAKHHFQQNLDVRIVADEEAATCPEAVPLYGPAPCP